MFARAPQLRGFLLFVANRALTGRHSDINECEIACAVLGRKSGFDPHEDNIVRVQARHLRAKLDQYFETEGKEENLIVTIPRGTYVPYFGPRVVPVQQIEIQPAVTPPAQASRLMKFAALGLALLTLLALVVALILRIQGSPVSAKVNKSAIGNPLLSRVFLPGDTAKIVMSDAGLVVLQEFLHHKISLESYLKGDYPRGVIPQSASPDLEKILERDCVRSYTTYGDVGAANRLLQLGHDYQAKAVIRHPRHLNVRDFETGGFVLLGGPLANPWYALFESQLNFVFEINVDTGNVLIRNKVPQRGEQATYSPSSAESQNQGPISVDYAVVALLPNLKNSGNVLLLAGTAMQGTEAAGDTVVRDDLPADLQNIVRNAKGPADTIEILLEAQVVAGIPRDVKVVAYRAHSAGR